MCVIATTGNATVYLLPLSSPSSLPSYLSTPDKSPQLTEFVTQIKSNADTAQLFESIQADASLTLPVSYTSKTRAEAMDIS